MLTIEDVVEAFPVPQEYPLQPPIKTYIDTNVINVMRNEFKPPSELAAPIPPYRNPSATHTPIHPLPSSSTKDILTELPVLQLGNLLLDNAVLQPQPLPPPFVFNLEEEPYEMHHGEKFLQYERPLPLHETPHKRNDNSDEVLQPLGSSSDRDDTLNRMLIHKNSKIQFQNMKVVLEEKMKPQHGPSKLTQYEYHPRNEELASPERLSFQEYPSIPILDDQNQIQEILQQEALDKIENTENPLDTLDNMLSETKIVVQELTIDVNNG
jgi:hypothetical protein